MSVPSSRVEHDTANRPQTQLLYLCLWAGFDETDFPNKNPTNSPSMPPLSGNKSRVDTAQSLAYKRTGSGISNSIMLMSAESTTSLPSRSPMPRIGWESTMSSKIATSSSVMEPSRSRSPRRSWQISASPLWSRSMG